MAATPTHVRTVEFKAESAIRPITSVTEHSAARCGVCVPRGTRSDDQLRVTTAWMPHPTPSAFRSRWRTGGRHDQGQ